MMAINTSYAVFWNNGKDTNVPTNADHIRSMTDEELAVYFDNVLSACPPTKEDEICTVDDNCKQCWLEYLRQPYKEAEDG